MCGGEPQAAENGPVPAFDWDRLVGLLRAAQRICVTTHVRPDCDALGSALAAAAALEQLGKQVKIVNAFHVPYDLEFLDPQGKMIELGSPEGQQWVAQMDLLMILDTAAWAQLGDMGQVIRQTAARKVVLDHHATADDLGAEMFRDTSAEATGRLVVQLAERLGVSITAEMARVLFAAVATDTGWFRFASASARTYRLGAKLIDLGATPHELYRALYEEESLGRLRLVGRAMAKTQCELDGRLVYTWLERSDFDSAGAQASDSEDIINTLLVVHGTEVAVMFIQLAQRRFKVSFRSRCDLDCSRVAQQFDGGGHAKAAGALLEGTLEEVQTKVLDAVRAAMG